MIPEQIAVTLTVAEVVRSRAPTTRSLVKAMRGRGKPPQEIRRFLEGVGVDG
jgi:hypothetical protein